MDAPLTPAIMEKTQWAKSHDYPIHRTKNNPLEQCISNQTEPSQFVTSQHEKIETSKAVDPPKEFEGENQDQGLDLNKTPQQKPRRKKHRPKVIAEGKIVKTPKMVYSQTSEKMTGKRKYARKNKEDNSKRTIGGQNVVEPNPSKRKYARKNKEDNSKRTIGGQNVVEPNPSKKKYVRKNKEDSPKRIIGGQNVVEPNPSKKKYARKNKEDSPKRIIGVQNDVEPTPSKRNYMKKNEEDSPTGGQNVVDTTLSKRKYVKKNKEGSQKRKIGGQNIVEPTSGNRKYKRKKKEDDQQHGPESTIGECNVIKPFNFCRNKSVKRSLNFDLDDAQANELIAQSNECSEVNKIVYSSDTPLAIHYSTDNIANVSVRTPKTPSQPHELSRFDLMKRSRWKDDFAELDFNLKPMVKDENTKKLDKEINCTNIQSRADPKAKRKEHIHVDNDKAHANMSTTPCTCNILKKRRTENDQHEITSNTFSTPSCIQTSEKIINSMQDSSKMSSFPDAPRFMAAEKRNFLNCIIVVNHVTKNSSDIQVLSRNWASCPESSFKQETLDCSQPSTPKRLPENESYGPKAYVGVIANQTKAKTSRRRRKEEDHLVRSMAENAKKIELMIEYIARKLTCLNINTLEISIVEPQNALVPFMGGGMMIPYVEPFEIKKKKPRAKVDLDNESERVWKLLMGKESDGGERTNVDKEKWWEEERRVFHGRTDSFIARMHLIQGDRRFSQWKGSVVDSVIGVFLTQNVSDHLSSSAFMSLAAKFPFKSKSSNTPIFSETNSYDQDLQLVYESNRPDNSEILNSNESSFSERGSSHESPDNVLGSTITSVIAIEVEENKIPSVEDVVSSQNSTTPSINKHASFTELLHMANSKALHAKSITGNKIMLPGEYGDKIDCRFMLNESNNYSLPPSSAESNKAMGYSKDSNVITSKIMIQQLSASNSEIKCCQNQTYSTIDVTSESLTHEDGNTVMFKMKRMQNDVDAQGQSCSSSQKESHLRNSAESLKNNGSNKEVKPEAEKAAEYDWDSLRRQVFENGFSKERSCNDMDSLDYEALRNAHVDEISHAIRERGMNNKLAERIKNFLDRLVRDHGSVDLEWLRHVSPDKTKDYLLSIRGLGLKSVECVRLLTLHQLAFPVDTNVARISVRLGWVPLQPLPESLQLHLLEMYPVMETIQKYLWPRLCKLDQQKLYELHYQLITFGKVFCTKSKPNCNSCPMRGDCKHFASAYASARLALPGPDEKCIMTTEQRNAPIHNAFPLPLPQLMEPAYVQENNTSNPRNYEPIIEEPSTPEPACIEETVEDIEDAFYNDPDDIPTIKLNFEEFTQNLQNYIQENNMQLKEGILSNALVAVSTDAATIPVPKLKNVNRLRTEHLVYELPDGHPLLEGMDTREPDDPSHYLLAIWTAGETALSTESPKSCCDSQDSGKLCNTITCFSCNSIRESQSQIVRGTILIPCRTANRGSFPLNGTYFQVNEVFADHDSSRVPIDVPRKWIWNLNRRTVYFGSSIPSIFKGLTTEEIQHCFWRGFVCVRGFDRATRAPKPLFARLHFPASKLTRTKKTTATAAKETTRSSAKKSTNATTAKETTRSSAKKSTNATTAKATTTVTTAEAEKTTATISTVIAEQDISVQENFQSKSSDNISSQININDIPIN